MHRYEVLVLEALKAEKKLTLDQLIKKTGIEKGKVLWAIENLSQASLININRISQKYPELTDEAQEYIDSKMPEEMVVEMVSRREIPVKELNGKKEQIGLQWAKKKNLVEIALGNVKLTSNGKMALENGVEEGRLLKSIAAKKEDYEGLSSKHKDAIRNLMKRGLLLINERSEIQSVSITEKGEDAAKGAMQEEDIEALNKSMIINSTWAGKSFKKYDVDIDVDRAETARRHPLRNFINDVKNVYASLGFREVSGPIIEPAFWVFDSLFVPQDHPARDVQDTFYLSYPERIRVDDAEELQKIKKVHLGSWKGDWSREVAEQALLRTHTTNVSARYIHKIVNQISARRQDFSFPVKLFSVGRVFRNENIDYKHLTDFYQMDGIVIGKNLKLANLFDILIRLYAGFGIKVKFKPSYFPFVEPGAEIYGYYKERKQFIELGGCGVIRSEVTGVPKKKLTVLAWGPGVERILLLNHTSIENISELYNNGIGWLRQRAM